MAAVGNHLSLVGMPEGIPELTIQFLSTLDLNCLRVTTKKFKEFAEHEKKERDKQYRDAFPDRFAAIQMADARFTSYSDEQRNALGSYANPAGRPVGFTWCYEYIVDNHTFIKVVGYEETMLVRDLKYALINQYGDVLNGQLRVGRTFMNALRRIVRDEERVQDAFPDFIKRCINLDDASLGDYLCLQQERQE